MRHPRANKKQGNPTATVQHKRAARRAKRNDILKQWKETMKRAR